MWLRSVSAAHGVDARDHALALVQHALDRLEHERLVVADAHDVEHARRAAAVLALDDAVVVDLAAAGGVERRLDQLCEHAAVLAPDRGDRGRLLERLVAGEAARLARLREGGDPLAVVVMRAAPGRAPRPHALLIHEVLEALLVDAEVLLAGQLEREVEREAVRVVQEERLVGADALLPGVLGARDDVVEQPHALLEGARERLLLAPHPHPDRVGVLVQLRVRGAHQLAHEVRVAGQEAGLDPDPPPLHDRAPHQPAQHVAAVLVRGHDAVGDDEAHPARVVGEDAQRAVGLEGLPVAPAGELLAEVDQRADLVGLEHRRRALHDRRHAIEAEPGVDVLGRQRRERVDRILVVLHEHEVPVLEEALVLAPGEVVLRAELEPAVEVELAARPARTGRPGLPEVLLAREQDDPLARDADLQPDLDRLLVGAEAELVVALEDGRPDALGFEPEALQRQLPRELRGALLEVVADREVAEHLEEREVPVGRADVVDVDRAEALLARRQAVVRRRLLAQEVRLERVHPGADQQRRRVVLGGDERRRRQPPVVALLEELEKCAANLVGRHGDCESRAATLS